MEGTIELAAGQVWEGFRRAHLGWLIRIIKTSQSNIEYQLVKSRGGAQREGHGKLGRYHLMNEVVLRDFVLIKAAEEEKPKMVSFQRDVTALDLEPAVTGAPNGAAIESQTLGVPIQEGEPAFRICKKCGVQKPITEYQLAPRRPGAHYEGLRARLATCHPCVVEARAAGIHKTWEARAATKAATNTKAERERLELLAEMQRLENQGDPALVTAEPSPEPSPEPEPSAAPLEPISTLVERVVGHPLVLNPKSLAEVNGSRPKTPISTALLELAAQAEALERPTAYQELVKALDIATGAGTAAGAVFVIPSAVWVAVQNWREAAHHDLDEQGEQQ